MASFLYLTIIASLWLITPNCWLCCSLLTTKVQPRICHMCGCSTLAGGRCQGQTRQQEEETQPKFKSDEISFIIYFLVDWSFWNVAQGEMNGELLWTNKIWWDFQLRWVNSSPPCAVYMRQWIRRFALRSVKSDHIFNSFFHSTYGRSSRMAGDWR